MREDMFKVIVERPRHGRYRAAPQARGRLAEDGDLPVKIGLNRHRAFTGQSTKTLNEHLNPLKRFLRKQVGRPWNKVFSEIAATLAPGHTVKEHVRQHIGDFVARIAIGRSGEWLEASHRSGGPQTPPWRQPFYIDPEDGILKDSAKYWKKRKHVQSRWNDVAKPETETMRKLDDLREFRVIDGVWYEIGFDKPHCHPDQWYHSAAKAVPSGRGEPGAWAFDLLERTHLPPHWRHAIAKRQLSGPELKLYGLANETKD